jgi:hypothetical protein
MAEMNWPETSRKGETKMEIAPVASVRLAPMVRSKVTDLGLTDIYEVERTSRSADETYTPHNSKAASGFEDDEYKFDEPEDEGAAQSSGSGPIKINYFV